MNPGQIGFIQGYTHAQRVAALWRVVKPEADDSDEFAKAVERDLANLPTFDPRAKRD